MSNAAMVAGFEEGAAILASLARGIDRASHELFSQPNAGDTALEVEEAAVTTARNTTLHDISPPPPEKPLPLGELVYPRPTPHAPLTADDASEPLVTFEDDDPEDMPGADEPATSPEPVDTPVRKAAEQRRQAKRAAKDR